MSLDVLSSSTSASDNGYPTFGFFIGTQLDYTTYSSCGGDILECNMRKLGMPPLRNELYFEQQVRGSNHCQPTNMAATPSSGATVTMLLPSKNSEAPGSSWPRSTAGQ
eukprot:1154068-Pelagomonas_calceolata.AAC.2